MTGPCTVSAISRTASNSPGDEIGNPGLQDVHVQPGELLGDLDLLGLGEGDAGCLLPVAQGGVEDPYGSIAVYRYFLLAVYRFAA